MPLKWPLSRVASTALLSGFLIAGGMGARAAVAPTVTGQHIRDFARVTFEWPDATTLDAKADGNVVTIRLERASNPNFGGMLKNLSPYVKKAEVLNGGKTVRLTLDREYRVRSFVSGNVSGVDILGVGQAPKTVQQAEAPPPAPAPAPAIKPEPKQAVKPSKTAAKTQAKIIPKDPASVAMKTAAAVKPVQAQPLAKPQPAPKPAALQQATPEPPIPDVVEMHANAAAIDAISPAAAAPEEDTHEAAQPPVATAPEPTAEQVTAQPAAAEPAAVHEVKVGVTAHNGMAEIHLSFQERTALAAFVRGRVLWLIYNREDEPNLAAFSAVDGSLFGTPKVIPLKNSMAIRLPLATKADVSVGKGESDNSWRVLVGNKPAAPAASPDIQAAANLPPRPHVFVAMQEPSPVISYTDPDVGDTVLAVPSFRAGEGIGEARRFVEFSMPATAQGMIVEALADDVEVTGLRNGIRITTEKGMQLTGDIPDSKDVAPKDKAEPPRPRSDTSTLFPYDKWKPADPEKATEERLQLFSEAAMLGTAREASKKRLELAERNMHAGLWSEALGTLTRIQQTDAPFFVEHKLNAHIGAALFMMHRYNEAADAFAAAELKDVAELDYWRAMTAELLGSPDQTFDYLTNYDAYISKYPPEFRQRLAILAADRSIAAKQPANALKILDTLATDGSAAQVGDYVNFLMGKIAMDAGRASEGLELWQKLADSAKDPLVRARAEFSLLSHRLKAKALTPEQAILKLESIILSWHGDILEQNALKLLGDLYDEKGDYTNALRVWRDLNTSFPNTDAAIDATRKMGTAFVRLFDEGKVEALPLFDQLALYYDYRELTPTDAAGDRITAKLADKLIAADLLDQAAALLEQRVKFRFTHEERSEAGAKLAEVYLLNHKPAQALDALNNSAYGDNPPELRARRDRLSAEALIMQGQTELALTLLKDDTTKEASRLKLQALWQQKAWPEYIAAVEALLRERADPSAPATAEEGEMLTRLALAYVATDDMSQLRYLSDYFGPLMKGNPKEQVFLFATRNETPVLPATFEAAMAEVDGTRNFLKNYPITRAALSVPAEADPSAVSVPGAGQ